MLMDWIRKEIGGTVYGRDIRSAFNSLYREKMYTLLHQHPEIQKAVDTFLRPRIFDIRVDREVAQANL